MQTGDMVVLSHGDLAQSMRASMAVPGVFAPVTIDDKVLGDGGLSRNLPVDIARQTCADVVIAVSVPNPPPTVEDLQSPLTMVSRTVDVLIGANEKQQLATLGPQGRLDRRADGRDRLVLVRQGGGGDSARPRRSRGASRGVDALFVAGERVRGVA